MLLILKKRNGIIVFIFKEKESTTDAFYYTASRTGEAFN